MEYTSDQMELFVENAYDNIRYDTPIWENNTNKNHIQVRPDAVKTKRRAI